MIRVVSILVQTSEYPDFELKVYRKIEQKPLLPPVVIAAVPNHSAIGGTIDVNSAARRPSSFRRGLFVFGEPTYNSYDYLRYTPRL